MSIETYANTMMRLYIVLFLIAILVGVVAIWRGIRKKPLKRWWMIPYSLFYSIFASYSVFIPYIAYDDPADPNYRIFKNWRLHNFVLNDIKIFAVWLLVGVLLCFISARKGCKRSIKTGCIALLIFLAVLLLAAVMLSITKIS